MRQQEGWEDIQVLMIWKKYEDAMKKQYGTRAPSSRTIAPAPVPTKTITKTTPTVSKPTVSKPTVSKPTPSRTTAGGGGGGVYSYPTITAPSVPDYMALAKLWLAKYPELLLPDVGRAEYLTRSGEEIRPMFEAQESKLRRQAGEEEVERLQEAYGKGLIGGISKEALVDVNKRLTEVLGEMAFSEESMVAGRASEMEQTAISNAMNQHALRIQDWGNQYGVSEAAMRNTFLDQMTKAGFEAQQAQSAWQASFAQQQFGLEQEKFDWQKSFAEKEFDWKKSQASQATTTIINNEGTYKTDDKIPSEDEVFEAGYKPTSAYTESTYNYWQAYEKAMKKRYRR